MKTDFIPFWIGMPYENWEFDLEPLEFAKYYDKYKYIKKDIPEVLEAEVKHIHLYFKLDVLFKVEIVFNPVKPLVIFLSLCTKLQALYGIQPVFTGDRLITIEIFWNEKEINLGLIYNFKQNKMFLKLERSPKP